MEDYENKGIVIKDDSLENALTRASELLHIDRARVSYRVIESGSGGILGLFGKKKLVIRAWADELIPKDILTLPDSPKTDIHGKQEASGKGKKPRGRDASPERDTRRTREKPRGDDTPRERTAIDPSLRNDPQLMEVKEFLTGLLTRMGAEFTISEYRTEDGILMNVSSNTEGMLIGRKGQTLDALQYILNRYLSRPSGFNGKITLDVENYRERREAKIQKTARDIAKKVRKTGKPIAAQPMASGERRIFHLALKHDTDLSTESRGRGEKRKVIVYPKKTDKNRS
ncbi:MAG: Jag N-terminal domain-containing protein [Deltaproteobacteria bacterium]|nr:Jag N-terminal domain-containing protein [Candidatus Zymogenaceae bacterium]